MSIQGVQTAVKNVAIQVQFFVYSAVGVPLTGLTKDDIRLVYLKPDAASLVGKTLTASNFSVIGNGLYAVTFTATEMDTAGVWMLRASKAVAYPGTMLPTVLLLYVTEEAERKEGFLQNRRSWIPVLLEDGGVPKGGLVPASFSLARYRRYSDTSFTSITLSAGNFRELLDLGSTTGIYQLLRGADVFSIPGPLLVQLDGATVDFFSYAYEVAAPVEQRCYFSVTEDGVALANVTLHITDTATGLVVATLATDIAGECIANLPVGTYKVTLTYGTRIFDENNTEIEVQDTNNELHEATGASILSGNAEQFALVDGDTFQIQMNDGEIQTVTFDVDDPALVPPQVLGNATASYIASILNRECHSLQASAGGLNRTQLLIESLNTGSSAKVKVVGGTANTIFNFDTTEVSGEDAHVPENSWALSGLGMVPAFPSASSDLVKMIYRVLDIRGLPVEGMEVDIVNKYDPTVRAASGTCYMGNRILQFFTDADGYAQDPNYNPAYQSDGLPRLIKGAKIDVILRGTGVVRPDLTVPQADFKLIELVAAAPDMFTVQYPHLPPAPRS